MTDYYHNSNPGNYDPSLQPPGFFQPGIPVHNEQVKPEDPWKEEQPFQLPPDLPGDFPEPPYAHNPDPWTAVDDYQAKLKLQCMSISLQMMQLEIASLQQKLYGEEVRSAMFISAATELLRVVAGIGGYVPDDLKDQLFEAMNNIHELVAGVYPGK